jgi:hypothetical protein
MSPLKLKINLREILMMLNNKVCMRQKDQEVKGPINLNNNTVRSNTKPRNKNTINNHTNKAQNHKHNISRLPKLKIH